jgi:hypothetical protein
MARRVSRGGSASTGFVPRRDSRGSAPETRNGRITGPGAGSCFASARSSAGGRRSHCSDGREPGARRAYARAPAPRSDAKVCSRRGGRRSADLSFGRTALPRACASYGRPAAVRAPGGSDLLAGEAWRPGCVPNRPRSRRSSRSRSPRSCLRRWLTTPSCAHDQDQARSRRRAAALSLRGGADVSSLPPQLRSFGKTRDANRPSRLMLTPRPHTSRARGRSSSAARTKEKVFALSDLATALPGGMAGE